MVGCLVPVRARWAHAEEGCRTVHVQWSSAASNSVLGPEHLNGILGVLGLQAVSARAGADLGISVAVEPRVSAYGPDKFKACIAVKIAAEGDPTPMAECPLGQAMHSEAAARSVAAQAWTQERRKQLAAAIEALLRRVIERRGAGVAITSEPAGAEVYSVPGGAWLGKTPLRIGCLEDGQKLEAKLTLAGYQDHSGGWKAAATPDEQPVVLARVESPTPPQGDTPKERNVEVTDVGFPPRIYIPFALGALGFLVFLLVGAWRVFHPGPANRDMLQILGFVAAVTAGCIAGALTGYIKLGGDIEGVGVQATGGLAVFVLTFLFTRKWGKSVSETAPDQAS